MKFFFRTAKINKLVSKNKFILDLVNRMTEDFTIIFKLHKCRIFSQKH
jgi:hypothetical protein